MRLKITESKNARSLYVIKSIYKDGKHTSKIVEKLGTYAELLKKLNGADPIAWAHQHIDELNAALKEENQTILVPYSTSKQIRKGEQRSVKGGYLFLAPIYHALKLDKICKDISEKYKSTFNLNAILSRLIYGRILFPGSKLNTTELSAQLIEPPDFEIQHVYRALEMISKETDFIQSEIYQNSLALSKRNKGVLYYDCTNYFFEIEQEAGLKQYGYSKEHRPNPIVQMGLFMDGDGIPLAFHIDAGNTNEQITLKPLEKQILKDFDISRFVVCTDAGLASNENRLFNDQSGRAFITTQSVKKLKAALREWALSPLGWKLDGTKEQYDISQLEQTAEMKKKYQDKTFFKECRMHDNGLEQRLIVTYSMKPFGTTKVASEEVFDGFYALCTNLGDPVQEIVKVNQRRWEIEECFRIMKTEFKA
ncbi:MAG: transposase, partial [Clostridia bacterium]